MIMIHRIYRTDKGRDATAGEIQRVAKRIRKELSRQNMIIDIEIQK